MKTFKSNLVSRSFLRLLLLLLVAGVVSQTQAQNVNSGAGTYTFPHNSTYPHGFMATGLPSATASNAVSTTYRDWYSHAVLATGVTRSGFPTCTSCLRVFRNTNSNDTVSEGIGYGMLIAVMMDDKTLFDGLYKYAYQWMPDSSNNMVMDWDLNSGGGIISPNGATDADEDMAMAFLIASKIWPTAGAIALTNSQQTSTSQTYQQTYQNMMNAIWTQETKGGGGIYSGDAYQFPYYTSYMTPAWYSCWNTYDSQGHNWSSMVTWVYNTYFKGLSTNSGDVNGFFPETATSGLSNNTSSMGFDASRYPMRVGLDYLWNGTAGANTYAGTFATNVMTAVNANGFNTEVGDTWTVPGGTPGGSFCDSLQIGPLAVAAMLTTQANATSAYNQLIARYGSPACNGGAENFQYFQDTLCMMCELITTGNFPNIVCGTPPCGSLTCTPTPSPTPLACYMLSDDADGTEENHTNGFWFSYTYASVNNTPVVTPVLMGVSNTNYILQAGGPNSMPYADAVTGFCAINGGTTLVTYGGKANQLETVYAGYALGTELKPGYQNLNSMTNISFWVKATTAPATLQVAFYNPNIDVPAGGKANKYKNVSHMIIAAANTWQYVSIPSGIANIAPSTYAPALGSGPTTYTYAMAMSQVTSLQWQEVAPSTGVTYGFSVGQVCIAGTSWVTPTPLATATPVVTILPTSTVTQTPTKTVSPTMTATLTASPTFTKTMTLTSTISPTNTPSFTPTSAITPTSTATGTPTFTKTITLTITPTLTPTLALTATPTFTKTITFTITPTLTPTLALTATPTATPTNTTTPLNTATPTLTKTVTSTFTTTQTPTISSTPTATSSPTITQTPSNTGTPTSSPTVTLTPQFTYTPSDTFTVTNTPTATITATPTFTSLFTSTVTSSPTKTFTPTPTLTLTSTATATPTLTPTLTLAATSTLTQTPTPTLTLAPTSTLTQTPTATLVPGVSFGTPQFTGAPVPNSPFSLSVPFSVSGSTATGVVFTDNLPAGLTFSGFTGVPAGGTTGGTGSSPTISWATLPAGTYTITLTGTIDSSASGTLNNGSVLSYNGGGPISTPSSITVTPLTATPTVTATQSSTPIIPVAVTTPIPYPNPATTTGPIDVSVSFGQPTGPVYLEIYTTAFRKVRSIPEGQVTAGTYTWPLYLVDNQSVPLANGLYYIVISTPNGRGIGKVLVLR